MALWDFEVAANKSELRTEKMKMVHTILVDIFVEINIDSVVWIYISMLLLNAEQAATITDDSDSLLKTARGINIFFSANQSSFHIQRTWANEAEISIHQYTTLSYITHVIIVAVF